MNDGYGEGEYAVGRGGGGGNEMEDSQQYQYYGNPPQSSMGGHSAAAVAAGVAVGAGGMAGVGAMGRHGGGSNSGHGHNQQPLDEIPGDPYGGLDVGPVDGGYAVAATNRGYGSQNGHDGRGGGGGFGPSYSQRVAPPPAQPFYSNGNQRSFSNSGGAGSTSQLSRQGSSPQLSPSGIPYHPPSPSPLTAQAGGLGSQFEQQRSASSPYLAAPGGGGGIQHPASPAPSHRSIPALGAVWNQGGGGAGDDHHEEDDRDEEPQHRALRVVNDDEGEDMYDVAARTGRSGQQTDEEERFGRSESAYDGLTAGLTDRS